MNSWKQKNPPESDPMKDEDKTKEELINEIKSLREQSTRFEALRAQHRENEEEGLKRELLLADGQHMLMLEAGNATL